MVHTIAGEGERANSAGFALTDLVTQALYAKGGEVGRAAVATKAPFADATGAVTEVIEAPGVAVPDTGGEGRRIGAVVFPKALCENGGIAPSLGTPILNVGGGAERSPP